MNALVFLAAFGAIPALGVGAAFHPSVRSCGTLARAAVALTMGSLALTITDQGQWREGADGVGLSAMRQRIAEVGGALTVRPTPRGTRLFARVPTPN